MGSVWTAAIVACCINVAPSALCQNARKRPALPTSSDRSVDELRAKLNKLFADLTPVSSGTGLIIFEPVVRGVDERAAQFATGCSRWLQFVIGGQPELGKTPAWASLESARKELDWPDLRVPFSPATKMSVLLGATHFVVGEVKSSAGKLEITYKLYLLAGEALVATIQLSGDEATIVAGLPAAATKLARELGAPTPRVPATCTAGPSGLVAMGRLGWVAGPADSAQDVTAVADVAGRDPAAAVMVLLGSRGVGHDALTGARRTLARLGADNVIALHTLVTNPAGNLTSMPADLQQASGAHPYNYLLNAALLRCAEMFGKIDEIVRLARQGVRISPRSARAWNRMAQAYSNYGNTIRLGRAAADITKAEWQKLNDIYLVWTVAAQRATELDPGLGMAWRELSIAACSTGIHDVADAAYWKAVALDSSDDQTLFWGLQMYQPKWLDDRAKLDRVVQVAVTAEYPLKQVGIGVAKFIVQADARYKPDADKLVDRMTRLAKDVVSRHPDDIDANATLAQVAEERNDYKEAQKRYLTLVRTVPEDDDALFKVAEMMDGPENAHEVEKLLRDALARKPSDNYVRFQLGRAQYIGKEYDGALESLRSIPATAHQYRYAQELIGDVLTNAGRKEEAIEWYRSKVRANPRDSVAHTYLIQTLRTFKLDDQALAAARAAKEALPADAGLRRTLAELLRARGDVAVAAEELRFAVAREQNQLARASMGLELGDILVQAKQKPAALKAYEAALADQPDGQLAQLARDRIRQVNGEVATIPAPAPAGQPAAPSLSITVPAEAQALLDKANDLRYKGQIKEAAEQYAAALKIDARIPQAHYGVGMGLFVDRKYPESVEEFRLAAEGMPADSLAQYQYGVALAFAGKYAEALPSLRRAIAIEPASVGNHQFYIQTLLNLKRVDEALAALDAAQKSVNPYIPYRAERGRAYEAKGDDAAALAEYRLGFTSTNVKPYVAQAHMDAGRLLWKMGRKDEARKEMQAVIDIDPAGYGATARQRLEQWK